MAEVMSLNDYLSIGKSHSEKEDHPLTPTFKAEGKELIGLEGRIGINNSPLKHQAYNKVLWHLWGNPSEIKGKFKVIGTDLKSGKQEPVLLVNSEGKEKTWEYEGHYTQPNLRAAKTIPSALWFDTPGK
ncbi:DUF4871 domain-containing protein [Peribacillus deserti]|uniref:Uncharacterized protein n=1 Tax=Peribacillus deserti TaxID=673318 RepID=A0A2N5M3Z3_9BACI|nr:DUF4871 domain-containing protein [Peribacillus deserti]PLT29081.1 hypothetical protein CUU66_14780 [Peribacillus deserti]